MQDIAITEFRLVKNHPYLKAVVNLKVGGLQLRGLRLEEKSRGELTLGFPGRKIQGHWQVVYEAQDHKTQLDLLQVLGAHFQEARLAA